MQQVVAGESAGRSIEVALVERARRGEVWLTRILVNACRTLLRRRNRDRTEEGAPARRAST